jgi:hypothetical protein
MSFMVIFPGRAATCVTYCGVMPKITDLLPWHAVPKMQQYADRGLAEPGDPDNINQWRKIARHYARTAQRSAKDDEYELATACASLATMYFALALDAAHFGELPEL